MSTTSPKHQDTGKNDGNDEPDEGAPPAFYRQRSSTETKQLQSPAIDSKSENVDDFTEQTIDPDIPDIGSAQKILGELKLEEDEEMGWRDELPFDGATQVQEQRATYNICTDGINTDYTESKSTKLIMSSEDAQKNQEDIALAKERMEQLKTEDIDEGLSLDEAALDGSDDIPTDDSCTTNVEQTVAVYNICSDGVNTEYSESKSRRLIKSSEKNLGLEDVKERLGQLTDETDLSLSLDEQMEGQASADRQHNALTNVKQKVTMYNICTDGVNTKYSQSSKKVSRIADGKVIHQVQNNVRKERRQLIAKSPNKEEEASCPDRAAGPSLGEGVAGACGGQDYDNTPWIRSDPNSKLGSVKEPDLSGKRREPVEDDSSPHHPPPQKQIENAALKSLKQEEVEQKEQSKTSDKELIKQEDAEYARLNEREKDYSDPSEERKNSLKEKVGTNVDQQRSEESVLILEARVHKLEEDAKQTRQSHKDELNSLRSQLDMLTYYCRNQNKDIEEGMRNLTSRMEKLEGKIEKFGRQDAANSSTRNPKNMPENQKKNVEDVRNLHMDDVRRRRADMKFPEGTKFGEATKLHPITRNIIDDVKSKMPPKQNKNDQH